MKLENIVYDVREALKEFSDDSELDNRYIEYLIALKRAKYIRQDLDRFGRQFNTTTLQTFCSPIEVVSSNDCGLNVTCDKLARTKIQIPTLLQLSTRNSLYRVAPSDKVSDSFSIISRQRAHTSQYSIFDRTKAFLHDDDYIYLINKNGVYHVDCISITGIFEDPLELQTLSNCCDCDETSATCYDPYADDYPVSPHMIDMIRKDVIADLANFDRRIEDMQNNSADDA